jgi:polyhydroxyalkanoate synthesis regulator phasin
MEEKRKKLRGKELITAGLATVATIHAAHGVYSSMEASEKRRKMVAEGEMSPEEARKRKSKNMLQDAAAVGIAALGIKSAFSEWKEMNEQRHSVKELEQRRRKRRKQRERREREARLNALQGQNAMANPYAYPVAANPYPTAYADANPYGAVPPPPIGAPPGARY